MPSNHRLNLSAGVASVSVALLLTALKLWALAATGALSVAASLVDSGLDLMVSAAGLAAILYAARPADEDHAFGHTSAEDLAALGQSLFMVASAVVISVASIRRLLAPEPPPLAEETAGVVVMVVASAVTVGLVLWQRRVAKKTGNMVVAADSLHYVGDLIPNLGAIFALVASARFGLTNIDSVVALGAAAFMGFGALRIGKGAWDALMDRRADPELLADIGRISAGFPGVYGWHDLRTRRAGSQVFVNLHIELDGSQTLDEAHAIGAALRRALIAAHPQCDVIIHADPVGVEPHPDDPRKRIVTKPAPPPEA